MRIALTYPVDGAPQNGKRGENDDGVRAPLKSRQRLLRNLRQNSGFLGQNSGKWLTTPNIEHLTGQSENLREVSPPDSPSEFEKGRGPMGEMATQCTFANPLRRLHWGLAPTRHLVDEATFSFQRL